MANAKKYNNVTSIFTDQTIREMSEKMPFSKKAMMDVIGVTEYKFENFGTRFLSEIVSSVPSKFGPNCNAEHADLQQKKQQQIQQQMQQQINDCKEDKMLAHLNLGIAYGAIVTKLKLTSFNTPNFFCKHK